MRTKTFLLTGLALALSARTLPAADRYEIDPVHSMVGFSVRHLVISNIKGRFTDFSGTLLYDANDLTKSSIDVKIKVASINTDNEKRDEDLRSPNFFDVANHPEITFKSSRIEKRGEGYVAVGTLTMHGVSREVALPFTFNGKIKDPWGKERFGAEATLTIDRRDWGLTYSKTMDAGGLIVGNEVKIELSIEAVKG